MKQTYLHLHFKKLLHFFLKSSQKRTLSILATLAIVLAIPVTIVTLGKQQTLFQHAADSPASGPIVAADASYSAGVPGCGDNPTVPPLGVKQFYVWKTSCSIKCDTNADCPQNTTDPNVAKETSNWCWGFNLGNGHTANRCMMLHSYGGLGNSADGQIHQANGCSDSALTDCVLHWRPDILPYYLKVSLDTSASGTGNNIAAGPKWTGACNQQRQIVQNWAGVDPQGYSNVVSQHCQGTDGKPFNDGPDASYNTKIPTGGKNQAVVCCTDDSSCNGGKCSAYGNVEASVCPSRRSCIGRTNTNSPSSSKTTSSTTSINPQDYNAGYSKGYNDGSNNLPLAYPTTINNPSNYVRGYFNGYAKGVAVTSLTPTTSVSFTLGTSHSAPTTQPSANDYNCTKTCQYAENGSFKNGWCVKSAGDNCGENINCGFSSVCAGR